MHKCLPVCSCLSGTLVDGTVVPAADRVYCNQYDASVQWGMHVGGGDGGGW